MSWWVHLQDPSIRTCDPADCPEPCFQDVEVKAHEEGGTYVLGGISTAELNVTYNYGRLFHLAGLDFKGMHGKKAKDTVLELSSAVEKLGVNTYPDYWAPTAGNAGHCLSILLGWAQQHPEAVWSIH